jgi:hypothetical protein
LSADQGNELIWLSPNADRQRAEQFGLRFGAGGTHQSKTMMLKEIGAYLDYPSASPTAARELIVGANILDKRTASTRTLTLRHLNGLYGIEPLPPITKALTELWRREDRVGKAQLALLCALARDPLLRDTAVAILEAPVGAPVTWPIIADVFAELYRDRFSEKMLRSLSQNCASTWTQSGHLEGAVKKRRVRVKATPSAVAFAALIATVCGFGGPAILSSPWVRVLDVSADGALDLLRQAEARGLTRVRAAGDVIEISVRQTMATALGAQELEHV